MAAARARAFLAATWLRNQRSGNRGVHECWEGGGGGAGRLPHPASTYPYPWLQQPCISHNPVTASLGVQQMEHCASGIGSKRGGTARRVQVIRACCLHAPCLMLPLGVNPGTLVPCMLRSMPLHPMHMLTTTSAPLTVRSFPSCTLVRRNRRRRARSSCKKKDRRPFLPTPERSPLKQYNQCTARLSGRASAV